MSSSITLSAGVRANLLSLQSTADLLATTQNRLATGKKVNSALDNPGNFFTSQSLGNRASDLQSLLDSIGQAQQNLAAANQGLTSLTTLVQSAKSIAKQAQQAPAGGSTSYNAFTVTGNPIDETLGTWTPAAAQANANVVGTDDITINVADGGNNYVVTVATANIVGQDSAGVAAAVQTAIDNTIGTGKISFTQDGVGNGTYTIAALNADIDFTIVANDTTAELKLTADNATDKTVTSTSLLDTIVGGGGIAGTSSLTVAVNGGANQVITFGDGAGEVSTLAELNTKLGTLSGLASGSASDTTFSLGVASSSSQNSIDLTSSDAGVTAALGIGLVTGTTQGTLVAGTPDPTRASLEADFNNVLTQISALAADASYNGINLLNGDNLKVVFNETGSSSLTINGVTFDAAGLGLTAAASGEFQNNTNIDTQIASLDAALTTLRTQASKFGSNLTTVQTRQDFTKNLITTLQTGADNLVLADTNEEGANLLALQTRQSLSTTALSLSVQSDRNVLKLFGG
jgi:flagellin